MNRGTNRFNFPKSSIPVEDFFVVYAKIRKYLPTGNNVDMALTPFRVGTNRNGDCTYSWSPLALGESGSSFLTE